MKYNLTCRIYGTFYHSICKKQLKHKMNGAVIKAVKKEYRTVVENAKDIGRSRLINSYLLGAYFIALNRCTGFNPEENYELLHKGLSESGLFRKVLGSAETYLDEKRLPGRKEWPRESHLHKYENDWVVDVLDGNGEYVFGFDYLECGICKLCRDEGCPELAKYLCRLDYLMTDLMGVKLTRTMTLAEGHDHCDFRFSRKIDDC